ncbi:MAG: acetylxylan esterase, partial [Planctomycetaceae bacterium]
AGLYDPKIPRVGLVGGLASFVTTTPYREQWLGVLAPGILRDVGDIPHLAALLAPRRLVIAGAVQADLKPLAREALDEAFSDTRSSYRLTGNEGHLALLGDLEPAELAKRLLAGESA